MSHYGTVVTRLDSTSGVTQLNGGDSVAVHNVLVANSTAGAVDIAFTQGSVKGDITVGVGDVTVPADNSTEWNPHAIFDKGFRVPALASGVVVTISWRPGV